MRTGLIRDKLGLVLGTFFGEICGDLENLSIDKLTVEQIES